MLLVLAHDEDAEGGALRDGLEHIGARQRVLSRSLAAGEDAPRRHGNARRGENGFGDLLVHRRRRGEHAGMRIGDAQELEHALHHAVLAEAAVQRVEGCVRPQLRKALRRIEADVEAGHAKTFAFERLRAGLP